MSELLFYFITMVLVNGELDLKVTREFRDLAQCQKIRQYTASIANQVNYDNAAKNLRVVWEVDDKCGKREKV